jgi:hypothetical protein
MATRRRERTIDPELITNSMQWADAYKNEYRNIKQGKNGDLLVLDSATQSVLVKTIPHLYEYDSTVVLSTEQNSELRAIASLKRTALKQEIDGKAKEKQKIFVEKETSLLEAIENWHREKDPALRRNLAYQIGLYGKDIQDAENALQTARYPQRHIRTEEVPKILLNYASKANGNTIINGIVFETTTPSSRSFTVEGKV